MIPLRFVEVQRHGTGVLIIFQPLRPCLIGTRGSETLIWEMCPGVMGVGTTGAKLQGPVLLAMRIDDLVDIPASRGVSLAPFYVSGPGGEPLREVSAIIALARAREKADALQIR